MISDRWVEYDGARLHCLVMTGPAELTPLVYIPGSLGSADDFHDEMEALAPRTIVAVSPRGLGRSSAPRSGYSFNHRISDLEKVLDEHRLQTFCLMAYSLGVPTAIGYASRHPERIRGLLLLDYPARYPNRSSTWLQQALPFAKERGIPEHVVRGIQEEAELTELWDELEALQRPVHLIRGGMSKALSSGDLERYSRLPHVRITTFENSGHEIHKPDYSRFLRAVETFLLDLDQAT